MIIDSLGDSKSWGPRRGNAAYAVTNTTTNVGFVRLRCLIRNWYQYRHIAGIVGRWTVGASCDHSSMCNVWIPGRAEFSAAVLSTSGRQSVLHEAWHGAPGHKVVA